MANSPQADSYQVGNIVNTITSDKTGNLIFSDVQNPNGVMLTQIKNSLNDTGNYDTTGTANTAMTAVITASMTYADEQVNSLLPPVIAEITGRINADELMQSQITTVSGDNLTEVTGRINADGLLQSQIITISGNAPTLVQAIPTPSLAVISGGEITITHSSVTNRKIVPFAKINTGSQYDPAVVGRTGSLNVDVEVTHPTSTTTVFKNVTGSTNDFIFKVLLTS